jgi:predicted NBD/HSP70 family sugar kinase
MDETGQAVALSVNVPGIVGVALDDLVAEALGRRVPVRVVSDAHAAAYDVWQTRGLKGRLLAISLGTGVGACVLDDGVPLRVTREGSSGHLGQVDVSLEVPGEEVPVGPDGGRGSLEAYIGLAALVRRYGADVEAALAKMGPEAPPLAGLARAIRIAHAIYRPDVVCLLGGVGVGLRNALPALRARIQADLTRIARPGWSLFTGDDDLHAARGAARLVGTVPRAMLPAADR